MFAFFPTNVVGWLDLGSMLNESVKRLVFLQGNRIGQLFFFFVFPAILLTLRSYMWDGCLPDLSYLSFGFFY